MVNIQHVMISDGGPHPAEKWAHISSMDIMAMIQIAPGADRSIFTAYRDFEQKLFNELSRMHEKLQQRERDALKADHANLHKPYLDQETLEGAVASVVAASLGTPFEDHFTSNEEFQHHLMRVLGQHFTDSVHIERCWHADRNPDHPQVKAFNNKRLGL